jgi:hypothetical protein
MCVHKHTKYFNFGLEAELLIWGRESRRNGVNWTATLMTVIIATHTYGLKLRQGLVSVTKNNAHFEFVKHGVYVTLYYRGLWIMYTKIYYAARTNETWRVLGSLLRTTSIPVINTGNKASVPRQVRKFRKSSEWLHFLYQNDSNFNRPA